MAKKAPETTVEETVVNEQAPVEVVVEEVVVAAAEGTGEVVALKADDAEAKAALKAQKDAEKAAAKAKKEELAAQKAAAKEAAKAAKEAARMPEQNGVRRPKPDGLCGKAWAVFDEVSTSLGQAAPIAPCLKRAEQLGLNLGNVRCEYAVWRKFHGITGRIEDPAKVAEKAAKAAEKAAKAAEAAAKKAAEKVVVEAPVAEADEVVVVAE